MMRGAESELDEQVAYKRGRQIVVLTASSNQEAAKRRSETALGDELVGVIADLREKNSCFSEHGDYRSGASSSTSSQLRDRRFYMGHSW